MRITSSQLRKIIVEELEAELRESEGLSGDGYRKAITKLRNILEMPGLDQGSQLARRLHDLYSTLTGGSRIAQESLEEADDSFSEAGEEIAKKGTEGVFTAKAKKRGMTAQEFARKVLANTEDYDLKTVQQASFAKGAKTVADKKK